MTRNRPWAAWWAVSAGSLLLVSSAPARANYLTARFGADYGHPAIANPYAIYFNPAAMGGTHGTQLAVDGTFALRWASYERPASAVSPGDPALRTDPSNIAANTGKATLFNVAAVPFVGATSDFGTRAWRFGVAAYVPFGGSAHWDKRSALADPNAGGASDGVQRWHNISGRIMALYGTAAASYTIESAGLSIGINVSVIHHLVTTIRARNADGSDDIREFGGFKEGRSYIDASGTNFGAAIGLYWQPVGHRRLRLGVSYTSQPGFGETRMGGKLIAQLGNGAESPGQDIDFLMSYADVTRLGGTYQLDDKLQLRADLTYARWSVMKNQCIVQVGRKCEIADNGAAVGGSSPILNVPRRWKDTIGVRAGVGYAISPAAEVFGSVGFTSTAVPKATIDASTIDAPRVSGTLGLRYALTDRFIGAMSYTHIYYFPVNTNGASQDFRYVQPSKSPSADGTYNSQIGVIDANLAYTF